MHTAIPASHLGKLVDSRYRLQRIIGEGASSWVFAATDERLEREVALKLFKPPSSEDDLRRRKHCIAEGRTLAKLVHPHIVALHDACEDSAGQAYLVMELCEAGTLETELVQRGPLALAETLRLLVPLMGALAFAHDRNIVHRDIKPGNIVLVEELGERRCKLLDFGISLGAGVSTSSDLALGTPAYMAPEQARGEVTTPATDVWALGVVLFRCLTGNLPFEATSSAGMLLQVVQQRAPRLANMPAAKSAPNVMHVLDRALEPDLQRRHRDVRSFARALAGACALDRLAVVQRPEPIGLPDFDSWVLVAEALPATKELPVVRPRIDPNNRLRRWGGGLALAAVVAAAVAVSALSLSNASETQARAAPPSPAPSAHSAPAISAPTPALPAPEPVLPAPVPAVPALAESIAAAPASGLDAAKPAAKRAKRIKSAALSAPVEPAPASPSTPPRVITSWDW
ncbi:MAG TPA: serine/threonine-protein kinase [Polyangiaceae bacterium]|nr:serine/threonine-protein kinase [Polyangiaceae bacterium]